MAKTCNLCAVELIDNFYKGVPNVCKECHKARAKKYREEHRDHYIAYDRGRAMDSDRVQARADYLKTERGQQVRKAVVRRWQGGNPEKRAAHVILNNAVRDGRVAKPSVCQRCGVETESRRLHAHHHDYALPLDVQWICARCHTEHHKEGRWGGFKAARSEADAAPGCEPATATAAAIVE